MDSLKLKKAERILRKLRQRVFNGSDAAQDRTTARIVKVKESVSDLMYMASRNRAAKNDAKFMFRTA
jgi:hypothetical protein